MQRLMLAAAMVIGLAVAGVGSAQAGYGHGYGGSSYGYNSYRVYQPVVRIVQVPQIQYVQPIYTAPYVPPCHNGYCH